MNVGLRLTSHRKDEMVKVRNEIHQLVYSPPLDAMTAEQEIVAGDRTSDLLIQRQILNHWTI